MGVHLYSPSVTQSYTAIATTYPVKTPMDNNAPVTSTHIPRSFAMLHYPMMRKDHPRLGLQQCNCIAGVFSLFSRLIFLVLHHLYTLTRAANPLY